ncbi:MAG: hypothetical protein HY223_03315 [Thaumarchaeota archaeon]|nr:hypothetical protein [Nitrososphaerota archaeon]
MTSQDDTICNDAQCHFIKEGISHKIGDHDALKREEVKGLTPESVFKPTGMDLIHSGIKTGLSIIPIAGGPISEIFSSAVESPVNKRLQSYLTSIDYRIKDLEEKGKVNYNELLKNDEFIDVLIQSSQIAVRNFSQPIKLEYLQGVIVNTALKINTPSDAKFTYLHYIDTLTPIQLQILQILNNPMETIKQIYQMNIGNQGEITYIDVVSDINKVLKVEKTLYDASIRRLETDYLIDQTDKPPGPPKGGYYEKELTTYALEELVSRTKNIITPFGKKFLEFTTEP